MRPNLPPFFFRFFTVVSLFAFLACTPDGRHKPVTPTGSPQGKTGDANFETVRPIFKKNCGSCHPGKSAPDWTDEKLALQYIQNGKLWKRVFVDNNMPQPGSPESQSFSKEEKQALRDWIEAVRSGGQGGVPMPEPLPPGPYAVVERCIGCHGMFGEGENPLVPYIGGQQKPYLLKQLADFKSGQRQDLAMKVMDGFAANLTDEEMELVATYYSRLRFQVPFPQEEIEDLEKKLARGEEIVTNVACTGCHADDVFFRSLNPDWPNLAGQKRSYIFSQLKAFRDGQRPGMLMPNLIKFQDPALTDEDLDALAIYFSRLGLTPQ
ncbi:MAG: c-type cytochrome [Bdellovibrionaceae bacterium]|nr:c-type cytochrome [Bdellovibrionales bacterium]MCB9084000.1 c-type cytochrome [Pseudobdellovibrionaceae bacterium]